MLALSLSEAAAPLLAGAILEVAEHPDHARVQRLQKFIADEHGHTCSPTASPTPDQLAAAIPDANARTAAFQRLMLASMLIPPLTPTRLERLHAYAQTLDQAKDRTLAELRLVLGGKHRRLTASLMRRFPPNERIKAAWKRGPWSARWRFVKAILKLSDKATAARYGALSELPHGTLGREFYEHCRGNGFPLPGERGGVPEPIVFHDMGHALVGKTTSLDDEVYMGSFEAGCMGERGFVMLEFALLLFNLGAKLPTDAKPVVDGVDVDIMLDAYAAGLRAKLDVIAWDPWQDVHEDVATLRTRYGIAQA